MPKCVECGSCHFFCENEHEYEGNKQLCYRKVAKGSANQQMRHFDNESYNTGKRIVQVVKKWIDAQSDTTIFNSHQVKGGIGPNLLITLPSIKIALDFLVCAGGIERTEHNVLGFSNKGHKYKKIPIESQHECRSFRREEETQEFFCNGVDTGEFRNYKIKEEDNDTTTTSK
jgi:hypothetical protein